MSRFLPIRFELVAMLPVAALLAVGGCSMPKASDFKPSKIFSLGNEDEPEEGTPVRIVSTWTDTVLSHPGQTPQRGFGGRLMFYEQDVEKPILVEGQLVVYAFDETSRGVTDNKPTRRYVFPPDQMPRHMSKTELGASYSFWLPWDEAGGPQAEVSLICRFEPKAGGVVTSEQTKHRLPGTMPAATATADGRPLPPKLPEGVPSRPAQPTLEGLHENRIRDHYAQLASYESVPTNTPNPTLGVAVAHAPSIEAGQRMTTTSIALPPSYRLPMSGANVQPATAEATVAAQPAQLPRQAPNTSQTPAANPAVPAQPQLLVPPQGAAPIARPPIPGPRLGLQAMPSMIPTVASPTVYSPTSAGFGFGFNTPSSPQSAAPLASQLAHSVGPRNFAWTNVQTQAVQTAPNAVPTQPPGYPQLQQTVVQPASQSLPPATGLTTTISYPTPATVLR